MKFQMIKRLQGFIQKGGGVRRAFSVRGTKQHVVISSPDEIFFIPRNSNEVVELRLEKMDRESYGVKLKTIGAQSDPSGHLIIGMTRIQAERLLGKINCAMEARSYWSLALTSLAAAGVVFFAATVQNYMEIGSTLVANSQPVQSEKPSLYTGAHQEPPQVAKNFGFQDDPSMQGRCLDPSAGTKEMTTGSHAQQTNKPLALENSSFGFHGFGPKGTSGQGAGSACDPDLAFSVTD